MMQNQTADSQAKTGLPALRTDPRGWFLHVPMALALGIGLYFLPESTPPAWWRWVALAVLLAVTGVCLRFSANRRMVGWLALAALGFVAADLRTARMTQPLITQKLPGEWVQGTIRSVERHEKGSRLILCDIDIWQWQPEHTPRCVRITSKTEADSFAPGQVVRMKSALYPLPLPALPGGYDFGRDLFYRGIGGAGFNFSEPKFISESTGWRSYLERARRWIDSEIHARLKGDRAAIASALIMGDQFAISDATMESMRASGLTHVLSISGLHVGLVAGLVFWWVRLLLVIASERVALSWPVKQIAAVAALLMTTAYLLLSGMQTPAIRAYVMIVLVLSGVLAGRKAFSLRNLGWAAVVILLLFPESLMQPGFQMSFAATLAIVALYEYRRHYVIAAEGAGLTRRMATGLAAVFLVSLVAGLATVPFTVYHFNQASHYGVLANLVTSPLVAFVMMPMVVLSLLLLPFGLALWPLQILGFGIQAMVWVSDKVAGLPGAVSQFASPPSWLLAAWSTAALSCFIWSGKIRMAALILAGAMTLPLFIATPPVMLADARRVMIRDGREAVCMGAACRPSFQLEMWKRRMAVEGWRKPDDSTFITCRARVCDAAVATQEVTIRLPKAEGQVADGSEGRILIDLSEKPVPDAITAQQLTATGVAAWYITPRGWVMKTIIPANTTTKRPWRVAGEEDGED